MNKLQIISNIQLIQKEFIENRESIFTLQYGEVEIGELKEIAIFVNNCILIFSFNYMDDGFNNAQLWISADGFKIKFDCCIKEADILQYLESCQKQISQL